MNIMNFKKTLIAAAAVSLLGGASFVVPSSSRNNSDDLFKANVEALADDESGDDKTYQEAEKTVTRKIYSTTEPGWSYNLELNIWIFNNEYTMNWPASYEEQTVSLKFKCCREKGNLRTCVYETCDES